MWPALTGHNDVIRLTWKQSWQCDVSSPHDSFPNNVMYPGLMTAFLTMGCNQPSPDITPNNAMWPILTWQHFWQCDVSSQHLISYCRVPNNVMSSAFAWKRSNKWSGMWSALTWQHSWQWDVTNSHLTAFLTMWCIKPTPDIIRYLTMWCHQALPESVPYHVMGSVLTWQHSWQWDVTKSHLTAFLAMWCDQPSIRSWRIPASMKGNPVLPSLYFFNAWWNGWMNFINAMGVWTIGTFSVGD